MWIYWISGGVISFLIAALAIGREAHRLDRIAPRVTYQIEEAVDFVAKQIPLSTQSRLTFSGLNILIVAHMNWLHSLGLLPEGVIDREQDDSRDVLITENSLVAFLIGVAERSELHSINDVDLAHVTTSHIQYLRAIGCLGGEAQEISGGENAQGNHRLI